MPQFLKQVINDQRMNKPSITVRPVDNQGDRLTARIFQGLIRNIEVSSNADRAYDMSFDDAVTMGFGYFRIVTEYAHDSTFEQDIKIKGVENAFTVYLDPDDLFKPKFGFVTDMVKRSVFKAKYGFEPKPVPSGGLGESLQGWYDKDAVRVAEYWRVHTRPRKLLLVTDAIGDQARAVYEDEFNPQLAQQMGMKVARDRMVECPYVEQYMMTGQEFGGDPTPWAGKWIPIIPVLGEAINIEGKRHLQGLIRHAKDPQRNFNYWRTVATETVALAPLAPWVGAKGQFESDNDKWATANRKPHAFLQYDPVIDEATGEPIPVPPPQRQAMAGIPAGALQEAANASDDMKSVMGLYDASWARVERNERRRDPDAPARRRCFDVQLHGRLRARLPHACGPHPDRPDPEDVRHRARGAHHRQRRPARAGADQPDVHGPGRQAANFDLSTGKYDVVVKVGPSFTTQREEVRSSMLDFIKMYPPAAPILGPFIAKNMDWPDSEKVSKMLQSLLPPPAQGQDPQREQMMQHIQQLTQQIGALEQDKSLETRKIDNDAYNAETNRLEAIAKVAPQALQQMVMPLVVQAVHDIMNSPDILMGAQPQGPVPMGPGAPPVDPGAMPPQQVPPQAPPGAFSPPA
jgi:hypothetical protein